MLHPHGEIKEIKHKNKIIHKIINGVVMTVAVMSPVITLPQLYKIYTTQEVSGISPVTWGAYIVTSSTWFLYGFIHKEKILMVNGALGIIFGSVIFIGTLIFS